MKLCPHSLFVSAASYTNQKIGNWLLCIEVYSFMFADVIVNKHLLLNLSDENDIYYLLYTNESDDCFIPFYDDDDVDDYDDVKQWSL